MANFQTTSSIYMATWYEFEDGRNRVGRGLVPATYCINTDTGSITDSIERGCNMTREQ